VVAVAPDGREVFAERSRDFTDRPDDEPVLTAVERLGLPALDPPPGRWLPEGVAPRPSERAFQPSSFIPYFRAIRFNTLALADRMADDRDREECLTEHRMTDSFLGAFDAWREEHPPGRQ
jgi:hypothetical protein